VIPIISTAVCETVAEEVTKDSTIYERIATEQTALHWQWLQAYMEVKEMFGDGAAEATLRLAMLTYKAINAQFEVNELEEKTG